MSGTWGVFAAFVLVLANGFFVATEFAIVKVRRTRIDELARKGSAAARLAESVIDKLDEYLSATQLGITLASLALGWIGEPAFAHLIEPVATKFGLSANTADSLSVAVGFTTITFLHIVLGELAPKSLAIQKPEGTTLAVALPIKIFYFVFFPLIWALNGLARIALRLIGLKAASEEEMAHSEEELRLIVGHMRSSGPRRRILDVVERTLRLPDRTAKDLMVARTDIEYLRLDQTRDEILAVLRKTKRSRLPVVEEDIDHVVGTLEVRDYLLAEPPPRTPEELRKLLRPPLYVPEVMRAEALAREFRTRREQIAIVVDEYGGTSGLVTLEDLVVAVFGEIDASSKPDIAVRPGGTFSVDPKTPVADFEQHFGVELERTEATTVGGLVMERLGRVPLPGDRVTLPGLIITVEEMDGPRILKLSVQRTEPAPAA
jgi:CBS domain containing-hemolysin-like protein